MGNEQSTMHRSGSLSQMEYQSLEPFSMPRTGKEKNTGQSSNRKKGEESVIRTHGILKTGFHGIWTLESPNGVSPAPRTGQFCVLSESENKIFVGYGVSSAGEMLNDLWAFSLDERLWRRIETNGDFISPRSGSTAAFLENKGLLVVFGGFSDGNFFSDLHVINVKTGQTNIIQPQSECAPIPRANAYFAAYHDKLYLFGGTNESLLSDFFCFDTQTMTWREIPASMNWVTNVPFAVHENFIYSYGGSKGNSILVIDMEKEEINVNNCQGACPVCEPIKGGLVYAEGFLFCFGGKNKGEVTLIYAMDIRTYWWFVYYMLPDQETTTVIDGVVASSGIFLLPSPHSFSAIYDKNNKCITSFLGSPFVDPPPISLLFIGDSLPIVNLRDDMLEMIRAQ